ncbi:hypothetical protein [Streptomyces griseomycini]|uniref:Uncharacterized protein n=1 Tax=Streptomyces griseomycini TaxID=66895 RepID=A0A7W7PX30_9ACTN|nr:hypothetical protein [Streptomyces griseomycini]MBB4902854.1 hypothetical protein [Streptomyces griseomycini]GGR51748.1 hypothetical protein GCM10015536_66620 [Streptomyces griseomycini]
MSRSWSVPPLPAEQEAALSCWASPFEAVAIRPGRNGGAVVTALFEHARREAHPEAVEVAHTDFAALRAGELPGPRVATAEPAR